MPVPLPVAPRTRAQSGARPCVRPRLVGHRGVPGGCVGLCTRYSPAAQGLLQESTHITVATETLQRSCGRSKAFGLTQRLRGTISGSREQRVLPPLIWQHTIDYPKVYVHRSP